MCGGKRGRFEEWDEKGIWEALEDNEKLFRPFRPEYIRCIYTQAVGLGWFISPPSGLFGEDRRDAYDGRDSVGCLLSSLRDWRSFRCVDPRLKPWAIIVHPSDATPVGGRVASTFALGSNR